MDWNFLNLHGAWLLRTGRAKVTDEKGKNKNKEGKALLPQCKGSPISQRDGEQMMESESFRSA